MQASGIIIPRQSELLLGWSGEGPHGAGPPARGLGRHLQCSEIISLAEYRLLTGSPSVSQPNCTAGDFIWPYYDSSL